MNLLFRILYAQKCTSTHHRLAMDALRYLRAPRSDDWCRLFLSEIEQYLDGAKVPDRRFRDFRNHVLHVQDGYWGGAVPAAELWYGRLVNCLKDGQWRRAVYCAGVLTHYVSDPFMPLHTGQTEDEAAVHRLLEWATACTYRDLVATLPAARGIHNWKVPAADRPEDWLAVLIIDGAHYANESYDLLIDHYDPQRGRKRAADGMDTRCRETVAGLLGRCIRGLAWVLDRAIVESAAVPPRRSLAIPTVLSALSIPLFTLTRHLNNRADRAVIRAVLREFEQTGRVIRALPEDDRIVRQAHAKEVLGMSEDALARIPVRQPGTRFRLLTPEEIRARRFRHRRTARTAGAVQNSGRLQPDDDVVDAPSIGPKTASRLKAVGVHTVADLLAASPAELHRLLKKRWITKRRIASWQQQAELMCRVPGLRATDARLLTSVGIRSEQELRSANADALYRQIVACARTSRGKRILRGSRLPTREAVRGWVESQNGRPLRAA